MLLIRRIEEGLLKVVLSVDVVDSVLRRLVEVGVERKL